MTSDSFYQQYMQQFQTALEGIEVSDAEQKISTAEALKQTNIWLQEAQKLGKKIMIFGNGGSAGVASHMAVDFWKNGGVRAMTFNDAPVLTCISNDYSYEEVFEVPVRQFAEEGDIAICISSSGSSINIRRGAIAAKELGCRVIGCSGFNSDNPLRKLGDLNFYVPSFSYGFVETLHQLIIHVILDNKLYLLDKKDVFHRNEVME
ncbi:MAG: SIS domain-containing protein [Bacteroidota bacterium]